MLEVVVRSLPGRHVVGLNRDRGSRDLLGPAGRRAAGELPLGVFGRLSERLNQSIWAAVSDENMRLCQGPLPSGFDMQTDLYIRDCIGTRIEVRGKCQPTWKDRLFMPESFLSRLEFLTRQRSRYNYARPSFHDKEDHGSPMVPADGQGCRGDKAGGGMA